VLDKTKMSSTKMTFWISLAICLVFLLLGVAAPVKFGEYTNQVFSFMTNNLGWSFLIGATAFLFIVIYLMISPRGKVKLGKDEDKPEYSKIAWFAMLFSYGMVFTYGRDPNPPRFLRCSWRVEGLRCCCSPYPDKGSCFLQRPRLLF